MKNDETVTKLFDNSKTSDSLSEDERKIIEIIYDSEGLSINEIVDKSQIGIRARLLVHGLAKRGFVKGLGNEKVRSRLELTESGLAAFGVKKFQIEEAIKKLGGSSVFNAASPYYLTREAIETALGATITDAELLPLMRDDNFSWVQDCGWKWNGEAPFHAF